MIKFIKDNWLFFVFLVIAIVYTLLELLVMDVEFSIGRTVVPLLLFFVLPLTILFFRRNRK